MRAMIPHFNNIENVCSIFLVRHFFFRATPAAYGGSQARGPIGAIAAAYTTATAMPSS